MLKVHLGILDVNKETLYLECSSSWGCADYADLHLKVKLQLLRWYVHLSLIKYANALFLS